MSARQGEAPAARRDPTDPGGGVPEDSYRQPLPWGLHRVTQAMNALGTLLIISLLLLLIWGGLHLAVVLGLVSFVGIWIIRGDIGGVKLDFRHLPDGYVVNAADVAAELQRIGHTLSPLEIVVVNTRAGSRCGEPDCVSAGCGMGYEATMYLLERGVCLTGTDAWTWDTPFVHTAKKYGETGDPGLTGPAATSRSRTRPSVSSAVPTATSRCAVAWPSGIRCSTCRPSRPPACCTVWPPWPHRPARATASMPSWPWGREPGGHCAMPCSTCCAKAATIPRCRTAWCRSPPCGWPCPRASATTRSSAPRSITPATSGA